MRRSLKATTAIVAGLHLALPAPLLAQDDAPSAAVDAQVAQQVMDICAGMDVAACADATGLPEDIVGAAMQSGDVMATDPAQEEAGMSDVAEPADAVEPDAQADPDVASPEAETTEGPVSEELTEPSENAEEAIDNATDAVTPPTESVEESAEEVMEEAGDVVEESLDDAPAEEMAPGAADPGTTSTETGTGPAEDPALPTEETPEVTQEPTETEQATPEAPATESAEEAAPETPLAGQEDEPAPLEQADETAQPEQAEPVRTGEEDAPAAPATGEPRQATGEAPQPEAAPETQMTDAERAALQGSQEGGVAAAAEAAGSGAEVQSETVTEQTARSSGEDFGSDITGQAAEGAAAPAQDAERQAAEDDDDDDGLSNLQKALIAGAGALAVGTLLNNNRQVVASSDDRVVVSGRDGGYEIIKDDTALLQRPGTEVSTESFDDGSTRTTVSRPDGSQIVTIRDADLRVLQRVRVTPEGERVVLIDDMAETQAVDVSSLRPAARQTEDVNMDADALREALAGQQAFDRSFSLSQVRNIAEVREQVPAVNLDNITFASGSAAITPEEADELASLGRYIRDTIAANPREIFLVEGHTDAVGNAAYNLALSDRRAESVALALTEYFDVPPENLVVQGYGERFLVVQTPEAERANRRATLRRITPLLRMAAAN